MPRQRLHIRIGSLNECHNIKIPAGAAVENWQRGPHQPLLDQIYDHSHNSGLAEIGDPDDHHSSIRV